MVSSSELLTPKSNGETCCPDDHRKLIEVDGMVAPEMPLNMQETGIDRDVLANLALRLAYTVPQFTTESASEQLCLPGPIITELLEQLRIDKMVEILGQSGPFGYRYAITNQGREQGARLMGISGYVGPAPVSLEAYTAMLEWQLARLPDATSENVARAIEELVLPDHAVHMAGLAASSRRSLFLYGPPGNGKTSIGTLLHRAMRGQLWIPHCIAIDNQVIRVFDPQSHERAIGQVPSQIEQQHDRRWVRIERPFIVVGGELTLEALDLNYSTQRGYYEAPLHFKANGGVFLLDDFGCQLAEPHQLLNRWIVPLDRHIDYLTLRTGQKIQVPFQQMLIVSTNINPQEVISPALLRRMGYRVYMDHPSPEHYTQIFMEYAAVCDLDVPSDLIPWLLERYRAENRALSCCEPRYLIQRVQDICHYDNQPVTLSKDLLSIAWTGYFGNEDAILGKATAS